MLITHVDDLALETRIIPGPAGKPWLIFLHEGLGSVSLWRDFPDKVARALLMPALIYSRQGYGNSSPLKHAREPGFMHHEALDVLPKLIAAHAITSSVLIGHSDGASIALIHAAHHPAEVAATVLMAPHVMVEPVSVESIARVSKAYETTDLKSRLSRHHAHVDDAFLGWSQIWLDPRFRDWSLGPECRRLNVPSLLIQGRDDEYGTLAQIDAIADAAQGPIESLILDHCGHAPQRDKEGDVIKAICDFAERVLSA
ncbi:MAG: alpha/beta hydrolase [Hyphomicrobiaceae bacterium]